MRTRTTFTHEDSSKACKTDVATSECFSHVLLKIPDKELLPLLDLVRDYDSENTDSAARLATLGATSAIFPGSLATYSDKDKSGVYTECQFHGEVNLKHDVLRLSLPGTSAQADSVYAGFGAVVETFREWSGCEIVWQGEQK